MISKITVLKNITQALVEDLETREPFLNQDLFFKIMDVMYLGNNTYTVVGKLSDGRHMIVTIKDGLLVDYKFTNDVIRDLLFTHTHN